MHTINSTTTTADCASKPSSGSLGGGSFSQLGHTGLKRAERLSPSLHEELRSSHVPADHTQNAQVDYEHTTRLRAPALQATVRICQLRRTTNSCTRHTVMGAHLAQQSCHCASPER